MTGTGTLLAAAGNCLLLQIAVMIPCGS